MLTDLLMLAQDQVEEQPSESFFVFGFWQILAVVGIIVVLIAYKIYRDKTMT